MKTNKVSKAWGISSMILGIIGIVGIFIPFSMILSILAIICAGIQKRHNWNGYATAGLVTGIIALALKLPMYLFLILMAMV